MKTYLFILFTFFLLSFAATTLAQSVAGCIYGKVTDEFNNPLDFATVRVSEGNILKGGAKTDLNGNYVIKPLPPGTYTVQVIYIGMTKEEISDVPLGNGDSRKVDVTMKKDNARKTRTSNTKCTVTMPFFDVSDPGKQVMYKRDMYRLPIH